MDENEFDYADDTTEDFESETDTEFETDDTNDESDEDPWGWAADVDPSAVKKTWNQYTETREEVLREKQTYEKQMAELEPIVRLRDEIFQDPGLVQVIDNYMNNQRPAEREVFDLKNQVSQLETKLTTDEEYVELNEWIRENELEPVGKKDILKFAVDNRIGSLQSAYKAMNFDNAKEQAVDKFAEGIKKSRGAKTPAPKKGDGKKTGISIKDIATMSDDDFEKNYRQVVNQYKTL